MRTFLMLLLTAALAHGQAFAQAITTIAGTGAAGYNGDDPYHVATTATLYFPIGLALDAAGNLYVADSSNHRIRKITPSGVITTIAGTGVAGSGATQLAAPQDVAIDGAGNLYVADTFNHRIQMIAAGTGAVSTVAGTGAQGMGGEGVAPTSSELRYPRGVAVDASGTLYISDSENHRVRKVSGGIVTTIAGVGGTPGCTATNLNVPRGLAVSSSGDLFIADSGNNRVMKLSAGALSAFAGSATSCTAGLADGGAASAQFSNVTGVAITDANDLLIADAGNSRIRQVHLGTVATISGTSAGYAGDGGPATGAQLNAPHSVLAIPGTNGYLVSDFGNHRVRKVAALAPAAPALDSATPGDGQAVLSFSAGYDGGAPITAFTASCTPGPVTQSGTASPITLAGLSNSTQYDCTVTATNAIGTSAPSGSKSVMPGIAPAMTSAAPPAGAVGVAYTHNYAATGTPTPTFAVTSGALPGGLSLSAPGAITGTPSAAGTYTGTVAASNGVPPAATQDFSITIAKGAQVIAFDPLTDRVLGSGSVTLSAGGGASGNPVVFSSTTPAICATSGANGATLALLGAGTCTVAADQAGNANYAAAPTVTRSFAITIVPTSLSLSASSIDFGGESMGTTSPAQAITVTNTGAAPLVLLGLGSSDPQFAATHNCAAVQPSATCTINVTFTPTPAAAAPLNGTVPAAGTLTLTTTANSSPHLVTLAGVGEKSLVTHYYRAILRRAPDADGKAFWTSESQSVVDLGANVNEAWFAMSIAFFSSAEYQAFNRTPEAFVTDLYATFFNRAPDPDGLAYWTGQLGAGMPREVLLVSFLFSSEFTSFSAAIFGNIPVRPEIDTVTDFYRGLLARLPDSGGFAFWVGQFRSAQCAGTNAVSAQAETISSQFAVSSEYVGRGRGDAQYVGDLYNAFLRRGGDLGGVQYWIGQLQTHAMTREQVRQSFRGSAEFGNRMNAIINAGCAQ